MKKVFMVLVLLFMAGFAGYAFAQEPVEKGFKLTFPQETAATAFWFPSSDSFAAGVSHTVLRVSHSDIPKFSLDLDGTLAKGVNAEKDNLAGIGIKLNYNIQTADKTGFTFIPSIGISALNNVKSFKTVFQDYRIAIYGTAIMYRW